MPKNKFRRTSDEVLYSPGEVADLSKSDISFLKSIAETTKRKRARICTHLDTSDKLHEMFIVHPLDTYVRPHRHVHKVESIHVLEGEVDIVIFDEQGIVVDVCQLADYGSANPFYLRLNADVFHTLIIRSDLVFHECTSGPFLPGQTEFADWSPDESDPQTVRSFMLELETKVQEFLSVS